MGNNDRVSRTPEEARIQKLEERMNDMVHVTQLRKLIEGWRNETEDVPRGYAGGMERCADDLEELIDDGAE